MSFLFHSQKKSPVKRFEKIVNKQNYTSHKNVLNNDIIFKKYLENARLVVAPFPVPNVLVFQHFGYDGLTCIIEPQLTMRFHLRFQPEKK